MGISATHSAALVPETRNAERAWKNICVRCLDICRTRDTVTSSQVSQLMGELHKIKLVHNFVESNKKERKLMKRVDKMLKLVAPIHEQLCNGNRSLIPEESWNLLEVFVSTNSF